MTLNEAITLREQATSFEIFILINQRRAVANRQTDEPKIMIQFQMC